MRAKLEISGWFKFTDDIELEHIKRGYIELEILPPINLLAHSANEVPRYIDHKKIRLWHCGTSEGIPFFQYK